MKNLLKLSVFLLVCSSLRIIAEPTFQSIDSSNNLAGRLVRSVAQDPNGFMWFGTNNGLSRFDGYEVKNFIAEFKQFNDQHITYVGAGKGNALLVGTWSGNVYKYKKGVFNKIWESPKNSDKLSSVRKIIENDLGIWIATSSGLKLIPQQSTVAINIDVGGSFNIRISGIWEQSGNRLLAISGKKLFIFDGEKFSPLFINSEISLSHLVEGGVDIFYGYGEGKLYKIKINERAIMSLSVNLPQIKVTSFAKWESNLWLGTIDHGLFRIGIDTGKIKQFKKSSVRDGTITDNTITSLYFDKTKTFWIGNFNNGIDYTSALGNNYFVTTATQDVQVCTSNSAIYSFYNSGGYQIIGTSTGAYLYDIQTGECFYLEVQIAGEESLNNKEVWSIYPNNNELYLTVGAVVTKFDFENKLLIKLFELKDVPYIYSLQKTKKDFVAGTSRGVMFVDENGNILKHLLHNKRVFKIVKVKNSFLLLTNRALYKLDAEHNIKELFASDEEDINDIYVHKGDIWLAKKSNKVVKIDINGAVQFKYVISEKDEGLTIASIIFENNSLWMGINKGIVQYELDSERVRHFNKNDGVSEKAFVRRSAFQDSNGTLYFGSRDGFNSIDPSSIKDNVVPPKVVLTKLTRFNEEVMPGKSYDGFSIKHSIEYIKELEIGHRDYVVGFEFAGLHYADPMRNEYQYKLEGFHDDWITTDAKNRTATFTNLKPGDYIFRVRVANKDGVWSLKEENVALKIKVYPAPWLSWWAFIIYGLMILSSLLWFIRYRTKSAIARAKDLEIEVSARTKEIHTQKNVIESLLERKNELFANISHEFRTPLTLILGPLEKELKALDTPKNPKHLEMIQRNATRLLGMVEQILKLTELKKEETMNKVPNSINDTLDAIAESFGSLAESKDIVLGVALGADANVMLASDALEVIVGNLISNAIKYTPNGGKVFIASKLLDNRVQISITDTGVGMTPAQQEEVFERFVRLDKTSDIAGTGIGLSIVKELILAHDGQIQLDSTDGLGSTFTISLPVTEQAAVSATDGSIDSISHLIATSPEIKKDTSGQKQGGVQDAQNSILIIEDNEDMQEYIQSLLGYDYHCLAAERGEEGIGKAIEQVPDLIISDVMMPGMDGYEVARRLRDDERTSHIPIILLTAKGDKGSRIQGWNENIDDYMTKPFDEMELKTRISNILAIRNILRTKIGEIIVEEKEFLDKKDNLNKRDALFLERLKTDIEKNFGENGYARSAMASAVALSERQFQRKLKALVNKTPMELLREYRLTKAAEFLKDGDQVGVVADKCGFSSISHFSVSFKAYFEATPKQYQSLYIN